METAMLADKGTEAVKKAVEVLKRGGIILYPTDTVYGLGVDATNAEAIEKLYALKGRSAHKAILVMVSGIEMAQEYVEVDGEAEALMQRFWPGALSVVLPGKELLARNVRAADGSVGVRAPDHPFCIALVQEFGRPITSTSANLSGELTGRDPQAVLKQFGDRAGKIDLVIDAGTLPEREPSTVVGFENGKVKVFRGGTIPKEEILTYLAYMV